MAEFRDVSLTLTYRLRGAGYKVFGAAYHPKSQRWQRHFWVMFSPLCLYSISSTVTFVVGVRILNCYVIGVVIGEIP